MISLNAFPGAHLFLDQAEHSIFVYYHRVGIVLQSVSKSTLPMMRFWLSNSRWGSSSNLAPFHTVSQTRGKNWKCSQTPTWHWRGCFPLLLGCSCRFPGRAWGSALFQLYAHRLGSSCPRDRCPSSGDAPCEECSSLTPSIGCPEWILFPSPCTLYSRGCWYESFGGSSKFWPPSGAAPTRNCDPHRPRTPSSGKHSWHRETAGAVSSRCHSLPLCASQATSTNAIHCFCFYRHFLCCCLVACPGELGIYEFLICLW